MAWGLENAVMMHLKIDDAHMWNLLEVFINYNENELHETNLSTTFYILTPKKSRLIHASMIDLFHMP